MSQTTLQYNVSIGVSHDFSLFKGRPGCSLYLRELCLASLCAELYARARVAAAQRDSLLTQPGLEQHGPHRRPLRRLLPIHLRRLDEEQSRSLPTRRAGASTPSSTNDNSQFLWGILEEDAKLKDRTPVQQKIGDYYAACMNTDAINARGLQPLQPELDRIAAISDRKQLAAFLREGARPPRPVLPQCGRGTGCEELPR